MSLCCCSEMTTVPHQTAGLGKKKKKKNSLMGPAQSVDRTCDVSRSQYSLFDALSDDEETDDERILSAATDDQALDTAIKRKRSWRKSIRKKMPWSKQ